MNLSFSVNDLDFPLILFKIDYNIVFHVLFSVYIILNKTTRMKNNHSVKTQNLT